MLHKPLMEMITISEILDDNETITTENGSFVRVIKIEGIDGNGLSEEKLLYLTKERELFFKELNVNITIHYHRKKYYKKGNLEQGLLGEINALRRQQLSNCFQTDIYVVAEMNFDNIIGKFISKDLSREQLLHNKNLKNFDENISKIISLLRSYKPNTLKGSEIIEFYSYLITGNEKYCSCDNIRRNLSLSDIVIKPKDKLIKSEKYQVFLTFNSFADSTKHNILSSLINLEIQFNIIQKITCNSKQENLQYISKIISNLKSFRGFNKNKIQELEEAGNEVDIGNINFHQYYFSICVYGDDIKQVNNKVSMIQSAVSEYGFSVIKEGFNLKAAFWQQFPDYNFLSKTRNIKLSSSNLSQLVNFAGSDQGNESCSFGSAVAEFKKDNGSLYSFTFHANSSGDSSGHTMVIGGTGSGKTTLISYLLINSLKYKINNNSLKILNFDSNRGLKISTESFGGIYKSFSVNNDFNLNPFSMENTIGNNEYLQRFLSMLIGGANLQEKEIIAEIVRQSYHVLDKNNRKLANLRALFNDSLAKKLAYWMPNEDDANSSDYPYGLLFNSDSDSLDFSSQIISYDMTEVLKNEELISPLTSYIFHRFNEQINKEVSPHIIFFDEAIRYIKNNIFSDYILTIAREQRKKHGILILATQEISPVIESNIGMDLIQNIDSFIIFPNPSANSEDFKQIGLNDNEIKWLRTPNLKRQIMLKRKNAGSAILDVDLSIIGKYLNIFNSSNNNISLFDKADSYQEYLNNFIKGEIYEK